MDVVVTPDHAWRLQPSTDDYPAELDVDGDGDVDAGDIDALLKNAAKQ